MLASNKYRTSRMSGVVHSFGLWTVGFVVLSLILAVAAKANDNGKSVAMSETVALLRAFESVQAVDDNALRSADENLRDWLTYGRTYSEQRYTPLEQISEGNVARLGLVWAHELGTSRGVEATPLVVDGVIYSTLPWSVVIAVDARSGDRLWAYDPQVPKGYGKFLCCDVVNRGPAIYKGHVYAGTIDGRLLAIDAATGTLAWQTQTTDPSRAYSITGAPRIVKGRVLIGNGGAEYGVRGYVSAYDAASGRLDWRFYVVPGDPYPPFASEALEKAAETWISEDDNWWVVGGGGTAWDSIVYDPEVDLVYIGTGNPSPWPRHHRAFGDNLFINSIVAVDPDDGELVWHYQQNPGDHWDYTSVQPITLANIELEGRERKVLLHAPKNGFVYVLDRVTGEFISAEAFAKVTWAEGIDANGRPIESKSAVYGKGEMVPVWPGPTGAHNWHPQSFNPKTGLLYIPAQEVGTAYSVLDEFEFNPATFNLGVGLDIPFGTPEQSTGRLSAWDPVRQAEAWRVPYQTAANGGTLTTGGNLVFQGTGDGRFVAYAADDGEKLWETWVPSGIVAGPVTYLLDGVQHVTVNAGWGGSFPLTFGAAAAKAKVRSEGWMLTFAIGGEAKMPPPPAPRPFLDPPALNGEEMAMVDKGAALYGHCFACHGKDAVSAITPDLRYNSAIVHDLDLLKEVVLNGMLEAELGMPSFGGTLTEDDVAAIRAYVLNQAHQNYEAEEMFYRANLAKYRERLAESQ